ncbi:unnamed protein product [Gongylonema pulchrum]|uniref:Phosphorylase b kinase regulatory subunit n=1 Tax=Gongylonema pulchrum TaxID=637853 RepID=A0A183D491_9BILA|nr:unnamed protein product [Gongylonema pulchrum]
MCVGCFVVYPATLAIQTETFSEYFIKGLRIQIADSTQEYYAKKLVGFSLLCETENLQRPFEGTIFRPSHIVTALFAGLFSYDGWDVLNFGSEEIEKPKRLVHSYC